MKTLFVAVWLGALIVAGCGRGVSLRPGSTPHSDGSTEVLAAQIDASSEEPAGSDSSLQDGNVHRCDVSDLGSDATSDGGADAGSDVASQDVDSRDAADEALDAPDGVAPLDDASDAPPPFDAGNNVNCVDRCAGDWPMPNPPATGLPHPQSYDKTRTGVITDRVTGLVWQVEIPGDQFSWAEAVAYCDGLVLAGADDWRLPSRLEVFSIVDGTRAYPAIDITAFPDTPSAGFWTSSIVGGVPGLMKYVSFDLGNVYYSDVTALYQVRCVRSSDLDATNPPNRYLVSADTVLDSFTMLTWQRTVAPTDGSWLTAKMYCDNLVLAGMGGWRLPSAGELNTLIDDSKFLPSVDTDAFPGRNETQWTSSLKSGDPSLAWVVTFDRGFSWPDAVDKAYSFRCVR